MKISVALMLMVISLSALAGELDPKSTLLLKTTTSWDDETLIFYPSGQPEISAYKVVIPPGGKIPLHMHPTIGSYYILKGNLTIEKSDGRIQLQKAGHAYTELVNQWHMGRNEGKEDVELIFFFSGEVGTSNTIGYEPEVQNDSY